MSVFQISAGTALVLLAGKAFDPEQLAIMSQVFEHVCKDLGFQEEGFRKLVARTVIKLAKSGVRESNALRDMAIEELRPSKMKPMKKWRIWNDSARYVGLVEAPDQNAAFEKAIRAFNITEPEHQRRLIVQAYW